jgi:hypothetical protein
MLNPADYSTAPGLSLHATITLAEALHTSAKTSNDPAVRRVGKTLGKRAADAKAAQTAQAAASTAAALAAPALPPQEQDTIADRTWRGGYMRLESWTLLPPGRYAQSAEAAAILKDLFQDEGLAILNLKYPEQRNAMNIIVGRIKQTPGLAERLEVLAGPEFVQAMFDQTKAYDAMVTGELRTPESTGASLVPHLRGLSQAIVHFAATVIAAVDLDDTSGEAEAEAHAMLAPIRNLRAKATEAMAATRAANKAKAKAKGDDAGSDDDVTPA